MFAFCCLFWGVFFWCDRRAGLRLACAAPPHPMFPTCLLRLFVMSCFPYPNPSALFPIPHRLSAVVGEVLSAERKIPTHHCHDASQEFAYTYFFGSRLCCFVAGRSDFSYNCDFGFQTLLISPSHYSHPSTF